MRKIIAGTVLAALALTGCGSDGPSQAEMERALVEVINEEIPETVSVPDQDIIDLGESICDRLDAGENILSVAYSGVEAGFEPRQAGFIVGASVGALCPEHEDLVENA